MNNCSSHATADVIGIITKAWVRIRTITSHATQILDVLSLTHFDFLKLQPRDELMFERIGAPAKVMMKEHHDSVFRRMRDVAQTHNDLEREYNDNYHHLTIRESRVRHCLKHFLSKCNLQLLEIAKDEPEQLHRIALRFVLAMNCFAVT